MGEREKRSKRQFERKRPTQSMREPPGHCAVRSCTPLPAIIDCRRLSCQAHQALMRGDARILSANSHHYASRRTESKQEIERLQRCVPGKGVEKKTCKRAFSPPPAHSLAYQLSHSNEAPVATLTSFPCCHRIAAPSGREQPSPIHRSISMKHQASHQRAYSAPPSHWKTKASIQE